MERCVGCGIAAQSHPIVGVGRADLSAGSGDLVAHPVCDLCWRDPAHRTLGAVKVTYFPRAEAARAVAAAKAMDAASKRGEDLGVGMGR